MAGGVLRHPVVAGKEVVAARGGRDPEAVSAAGRRACSAARRFEYPLKAPEGTDTYCYTFAEVSAMVALCGATAELRWLGDLIVGLAHTGLRISELAALRWTDIDLKGGFIRLPDGSRRGTREDRAAARTTKGRRERVLPLHPRFKEALEAMSRNPDGMVFHGACGGKLSPDKVRKALIRDVLKPLAERFPGTPGEPAFPDGRLHSFRHFFCSTCANRGVPEQMLMNWLGHRDSDMVKRYYHASREEAQRVLGLIEFAAAAPRPAGHTGDGAAQPQTSNGLESQPEVARASRTG